MGKKNKGLTLGLKLGVSPSCWDNANQALRLTKCGYIGWALIGEKPLPDYTTPKAIQRFMFADKKWDVFEMASDMVEPFKQQLARSLDGYLVIGAEQINCPRPVVVVLAQKINVETGKSYDAEAKLANDALNYYLNQIKKCN